MEKLPQNDSRLLCISAPPIFVHYTKNETQVIQSNKSPANKAQIKREWGKGPFYISFCPYWSKHGTSIHSSFHGWAEPQPTYMWTVTPPTYLDPQDTRSMYF